MKALFLTFLLNAALYSAALSQTLDTIIKLSQYSFSTQGIAINKGILLDYHFGSNFNIQGSDKSYVFRLNDNLEIQDSLCVSCLSQSGKRGYLTIPIARDDSNNVFVSLWKANADSFSTDVIVLDSNLVLKDRFKVDVPFNTKASQFEFRHFYVTDSMLYFAGWVRDSSKSTSDAIILSTTKQGSFVDYHIVYSDSLKNGPLWIEYNSIVVIDSIILVTLNFTWSEYLVLYDLALNKLDVKDFQNANVNFGVNRNQHLVKNILKTPKLQAVSTIANFNRTPGIGEDYFYKNLSLLNLDSTYSIVGRDTFSYKGWKYDTLTNFLEIPQYGTASYGFSSEDTIVTMATEELTSVNWPLFQLNKYASTTHIGCYSSSQDLVLWNKVYKTNAAHIAEEVVALPNNRWLLVFNEYDWYTYGPNSLGVRLIIIDGNGNPIGTTEDEEAALKQEPVVYPNPAQDYLTIGNLHWPGNTYTFQLTDLSGRIVQSGDLPINATISLPEHLNGIYLLTITSQTGFGWARKVVIK